MQRHKHPSTFYIKSKKKRRIEKKSRHYKHYFIQKRSFKPERNEKIVKELPDNGRVQIEVNGVMKYHYHQRKPMNKDAQKRLISVPRYKLKKLQQKILHEILEKVTLQPYCTGFRPRGSTVKNAAPHLDRDTIVKMDLENFFPSLKIYHLIHIFRGFGYSKPVAGVLACLCSDFYYGERFMPQGAPTSPMLGNLYCTILDARLKGLWENYGFRYTRYADDITLSSKNPKIRVNGLIQHTYDIIRDENLYPKRNKTKIFRKHHRKEVTGIIVNRHLNINRKWVKNFRAELHHYEMDGLRAEDDKIHVINQLQGKLSYLNMVNPLKAQKYRPQVQRIVEKLRS